MNQIIKHLQPERISDSAGNAFVQNELFTAKDLKQAGIQVAADHADQVHPGWQDEAFEASKQFLFWNKSPFMCETFRAFAEEDCQLPHPPHARAYGAVMQRAKREGLITHAGITQVKNPKAHCANASLWQKVSA
jgi:hypothetical protein